MTTIYRRFVDRDNMAWCDGGPMRVLSVVGPDAFGMSEDFTSIDAASDVLPGWTITLVEAGAGESTATAGVTSGGSLLLTTDANDNDGLNCQVDATAFEMTSGQRMLYFGIKFQASEATQSDFLVGLGITDTDALGAIEDAAYFQKLDGATAITFVTEKGNTETTSATIGTFAAATDVVLEFYWDGTTATALVNGVVKATSITNIPNDTNLSPIIHFLTGDTSIETMTIDWVRAFQVGR